MTIQNAELVTITPKMAQEFLDKSARNRKVSPVLVNQYVSDMRRGNWDINGSTIVLNEHGELIDGQHRCTACVKSGKSFQAFLVQGVTEDAKLTIDGGKKRTIANQLQITGAKHSNLLAGTVQIAYAILTNSTGVRLTNRQVLEFIDMYPGIIDSVNHIGGAQVPPVPRPSVLCAIHFLATEFLGEADKAEKFYRVFKTGVPAFENDPAHLWRERLMADKARQHSRMTRRPILNGTIHAWNLFRKEIPLTIFKLPGGIVRMKDLPKIV